MINKEKNTRVAVTVTKEVRDKLLEKAKKDNRSMSNYILKLIMKDLEDTN